MKTKITLLCLLAFLCFIPKVAAQCTTGTQKPIDTYQATNNAGAATINTDAKLGEYARVHIVPEKRYKFSTSVATDYVTVTNSDGSQILASGVSPVYYISVYDEAIRYYIHENAQCQTTNLFSRTRYLSWVVVPPCNDPTNVAVSDITSNSCKISWVEPNIAPTFGYDVHISTSPDYPADEVLAGSSSTNSYIWSDGLNADTTYYYWVRSDCQYQKGAWIEGGSFTTISSLACNGALYGLFPSATFTPSCTGNEDDISYDCKTGQYSNIAVVPNTQYTFGSGWSNDFITITNALGTVIHTSGTTPVIWNSGSTSGIVRFYLNTNNQCGLDASGGTRRKFIKCTTTSTSCLPPSGLAVSNITSNSCRLTWTAPSAVPSSGYEIYMVTNNTTPGTTTTPTLTSTIPQVGFINGLTADFTYYYWVRSNCGSEKSNWASGGSFTVNPSLSCNGAMYGLFPEATFTPACTGSAEQIDSACWAGEYSNVNVLPNKQYTFISSVATDYLTITNAAGTTVLASGVTPLSWASGTTSGVIRYHLNTNANCGAQNSIRTRSVKCVDAQATSCGMPTALSVSNITSNSSRLNWTAPATVPGSGYDIYIITTNTAPTTNTTATVTNTTAGVGVLRGLTASTTYYYWIRSNCGTTKSAWVSGGSFTTLAALSCNGAYNGLYPEATFTPACSGSAEQIAADSWAGEYSNVNVVANKQYTFTSSIATDYLTITNAAGTELLASGITPVSWASGSTSGVIRYHLNTDANCGTQDASRVRSIKCIDAPAASCGLPSGLAVSNITSDSCRLTWTAPASAPTYYDVYVAATNIAPVANTVATESSSTTDVKVLRWLSAGTNYHYWVRSVCGSVKSEWVSGGSFDTNPPLICNTAMYGLYPEDTITLANTGNAEPVAIGAWAGGYSNVNILTNKQYVFTSSIATDYLTITNATGTELLANGTTPVSWASGSTSGVIRFFVHSDPNCGTQDMPRTLSIKSVGGPAATCGLPSGLAVSNITSDSCRLTWTAPASAPTYYDIYAAATNIAPVANTVATESSSTTDVKVLRWLSAGTNYHYWVRSVCGSVKSDWVAGGSFDTNPPLICNTAMYGLYPEDTITLANTGNDEPVAIEAWAGGYSNVAVTTNKQYVFTSSVATDYLTITNAEGTTVLMSGQTPVTWTSGDVWGIVRFFVHSDPNCGTLDMPRTTSARSISLGIDQNIADSQLKIYPNPSAGQFTVETANIIADNIVIIDNLGRIISTHKPDSAKTTLTIDGFSEGIYFVRINYQDKDVTKKLVLKKN